MVGCVCVLSMCVVSCSVHGVVVCMLTIHTTPHHKQQLKRAKLRDNKATPVRCYPATYEQHTKPCRTTTGYHTAARTLAAATAARPRSASRCGCYSGCVLFCSCILVCACRRLCLFSAHFHVAIMHGNNTAKMQERLR